MKIGILTFHAAHNYGAVLQAYGLYKYLTNLGHEVYVIDYRPQSLIKGYRRDFPELPKNPYKLLKLLLSEPIVRKHRIRRFDNFENFIKHRIKLYPCTEEFDGSSFDEIIIGSDQVWNIALLNDKYDTLFWGTNIKTRCISYAASFGWYKFKDNDIKIIKDKLQKFSSLSIRETNSAEFLSKETGLNIEVACDPTLLLTKEEWESLCRPIKSNKPYVLCYNLLQSKDCDKLAHDLAKTHDLELIKITPRVTLGNTFSTIQDASPIDFLSYIKDADYVVTSSFHGTVFSILFNKEFYSVGLSKYGGRIKSLLEMIGLEERMLNPDLTNLKRCNYMNAKIKLDKFISQSKLYLNNNIKPNE